MDDDGELYGYEVQVKNGESWERLEDIQLYMYDDYTKLEISKADITTGEELAGASLELWSADENGNALKLIESWVSGEDGYDDEGKLKAHFFTYLPIGSYVLIETAAPEGYLTAENVVFTLEDCGEVQRVQMLDAAGTEPEPEPTPTEPMIPVPWPKTPGSSSSEPETVAELVAVWNNVRTEDNGEDGYSIHLKLETDELAQGILVTTGAAIVIMASGLYLYFLGGKKKRK